MKIEKFEELDSWKKARELTNLIYDLTEQEGFKKDFRLCGQVRDASGSIMHNIAEGFDAGSDAEFIRFLKISRRSASEVQSQLYLALDRQIHYKQSTSNCLRQSGRDQETNKWSDRLFAREEEIVG